MAEVGKRKSHQEYTVAWISALPIERAAATMMLDERHLHPQDFVQSRMDTNAYTWGRIGEHNVVIASLSSGMYGTTVAATTAGQMLTSLPSIRFGLLVGIGAGIPSEDNDVRLGDIVVSQPSGTNGGTFQYDLGKAEKTFQLKDFLARPPEILLKALSRLQAEHEMHEPCFMEYFNDAAARNAKWGKLYCRPVAATDRLFNASTEHVSTSRGCNNCNAYGEICREERTSPTPHIHYGMIGSGNSLIKNADLRDELAGMQSNCLCLEMEAAGLMNNFPCMVIRGICDYADSHKNDNWQRYAAAVSAAYAKELLSFTPFMAVEQLQSATEAVKLVQTGIANLGKSLQHHQDSQKLEGLQKTISILYSCPYAERKDRNVQIVEGTCKWFLNHDRFSKWRDDGLSSLLWVSADPGCGKSVLARYLIDVILPKPSRIVSYFFFKEDFPDQRTAADALCAILHQIFQQDSSLLQESQLRRFHMYGDKIKESFSQLWELLLDVTSCGGEFVCVIDALDECLEDDCTILINAITRLSLAGRKQPVKFLLTSRPYNVIRQGFHDIETLMPIIHLSGEGENEIQEISKEINIVIEHRIQQLGKVKKLTLEEISFLHEQLTTIPNRTYLWVHLVLDYIQKTPGFSRGHAKRSISELPRSVDEAYERILCRSPDQKAARTILGLVLAAYIPLSADEIGLSLVLSRSKSCSSLMEDLEPTERMQETIRDICGLFITIINSKVYLLHQTAREFLTSRASLANLNSNSRNGSTSSVSTVESPSSWSWRHTISLKKSHKMLATCCLQTIDWQDMNANVAVMFEYAALHWTAHFLEAGPASTSSLTTMALKRCQLEIREDWLVLYLTAQPSGGVDMFHVLQLPVLSLAVFLNLESVVELLLVTESKIDMADQQAISPLWWAARTGNASIVNLLLQSGLNTSDRNPHLYGAALHEAAFQGHDAIIVLFLFHDAKIDSRATIEQNALHFAAAGGHLSTTELLIQRGAHLETEDKHGNQALICAAACGHAAIVEFLLAEGAQVEARNYFGETPLFAASRNGHESVVETLLAYGADPNSETTGRAFFGRGEVAAQDEDIAARGDEHETSRNHIRDTAIVTTPKDIEEWSELLRIARPGELTLTPLLAAALLGHEETVTALLQKGANPMKRITFHGGTILHIGKIVRSHWIAKLLVNAGADINDCAGWSRTPREIALATQHMGVIKAFRINLSTLRPRTRESLLRIRLLLRGRMEEEEEEGEGEFSNKPLPCQ